MRYITYPLLAVAALVVIVVSMANRHVVSLHSWPDVTAYGLPPAISVDLPLYLFGLGCAGLGFVLGAAHEYLREGRVRRRLGERRREVEKLQREVGALKARQNLDEDDEIIALTAR